MHASQHVCVQPHNFYISVYFPCSLFCVQNNRRETHSSVYFLFYLFTSCVRSLTSVSRFNHNTHSNHPTISAYKASQDNNHNLTENIGIASTYEANQTCEPTSKIPCTWRSSSTFSSELTLLSTTTNKLTLIHQYATFWNLCVFLN